jgi:hypothetical protein
VKDPLKDLSPALLVKLASVAVHVDEYLSENGHEFDKAVLRQLLEDFEVETWLEGMRRLGFLPVKRNK